MSSPAPNDSRTQPPLRGAAHLHVPQLVLSEFHRGDGILDKIAGIVSVFVGSMWTFVLVTCAIVAWLFLGNIVGFDKTPWPLLLVILNLPQLSIMISLQVSANLSQRTMDARAEADHQTLTALHQMAKQQIEILTGQNQILALLEKDMAKGG